MILKVETEIIGSFEIEKNVRFKYYPFDIDVQYDSESKNFLISLSRRVNDYSQFLPKTKVENGKLNNIVIPKDPPLSEQIEILQHIESFGAIDKGIEKINWQNCSIEWIPENEAEAKDVSISEYKRSFSYQPRNSLLTKSWLENTIVYRKQLSHLSLPFSFFREGANQYRRFQYQSAFISFYLMLEGLFGNCKNSKDYKNTNIKKEFATSKILDTAITKVIFDLKERGGIHYEWFNASCKKYNKEANKLGLIHILVEQRGDLSHFSIKDKKTQKNPFCEESYNSLAFIAMMICINSSIQLRLDPFRVTKIGSV